MFYNILLAYAKSALISRVESATMPTPIYCPKHIPLGEKALRQKNPPVPLYKGGTQYRMKVKNRTIHTNNSRW